MSPAVCDRGGRHGSGAVLAAFLQAVASDWEQLFWLPGVLRIQPLVITCHSQSIFLLGSLSWVATREAGTYCIGVKEGHIPGGRTGVGRRMTRIGLCRESPRGAQQCPIICSKLLAGG